MQVTLAGIETEPGHSCSIVLMKNGSIMHVLFMGLEFVAGNGLNHGGPHVILKRPRTVKSILGDGNCLFRSFSYW